MTDRQLQIAELLWDGHPRKPIERKLGLCQTSVRNEIRVIADELHLDRTKSVDQQIVRWYERSRAVPSGEPDRGDPSA